MGLDPTDAPLLRRDIGSEEIRTTRNLLKIGYLLG